MTKKEARAYLKRLASAGRIVRDGAVWGYRELQTRRSKLDGWRTWCEVTFAPSVEDDPLMNMEVLRCKNLT